MWKVIVLCLCISKLDARVTDDEYALMPPVFYYDDFDGCMMRGNDALYCTVEIKLSPVNPENSSKVWNIIAEESKPVKHFKHNNLRRGVCIWQSCNEIFRNEDVTNEDALKKGISDCYTDKFVDLGLKAHVTEMYIQRGGENQQYNERTAFIALAMTLGALIAVGTIYDVRATYKSNRKTTQSAYGKILSCFSLSKNWKVLFSPFKTEDAPALKGIQGMRFLSMFSIIVGHAMLMVIYPGIINPQDLESTYGNVGTILLLNNTYSCQVFLVISGWLLSHSFFVIFEIEKTPNWKCLCLSFLNRIVRFTPCNVALLIVCICGGGVLEPGPVFYKLTDFADSCKKNWWANLLFIHNYYDTKNMCAPHSWYLATDIQLYLLSLVILGFIWKYPQYTHLIFGSTLAIAIVIPMVVNYVNDYDIIVRFYPETISRNFVIESEVFRTMYVPAHTNMGAYIIGLIFGYVFYKTKNKKVFTNKVHTYMWYILVLAPPIIVIYLGIPFYADDYVNNRILAALYVGIGKNAVSFSAALCIYGVSQGIGWSIKDFLFWSPFQILGKLCFCMYLLHLPAMIGRVGEQRSPSFLHGRLVAWQNLGNVTESVLLGLVGYLCIEMPFQSLQKMYIPQINEKEKHLPVQQLDKTGT